MNIIRMHMTYTVFCMQIKGKIKIETMEYLVFLTQYDSLISCKRPLLKYKIFIDGDKVRIKYISDLFRVSKVMVFSYMGYNIERFDKYLYLLFKYSRFTEDEIKEIALERIHMHKLDSKYFVYDEYNNRIMRWLARYNMNSQQHAYLTLFRNLCVSIPLITFIIGIIYVSIFYNSFVINQPAKVYGILGVILVLLFVYIVWTLLWIIPTKFEKKGNKILEAAEELKDL